MNHGTLTTSADEIQQTRFSQLEVVSVECAFKSAWKEMLIQPSLQPENISTADENAFSTAIYRTFDFLIRNDPSRLKILNKYFNTLPEFDAWRASVNHKGDHLDKRPDFIFQRKNTPLGESPSNGCFFIEAKLIEQQKTMWWYCGHGLIRFVKGDYAWATSKAMMLGYQRHPTQSLPDSLDHHLKRPGKAKQYRLKNGPKPFSKSRPPHPMYFTKHNRIFKYPNSNIPPGPIDIYHLWLAVDN